MPNTSTRVVARGAIWIEATEFPNNWLPSKMFVSVTSEDGSPLTGSIEINGITHDLSEWYMQFSIENFSSPQAIKITNYSGRPYRVYWWLSH
jgi:hypothetical protein